MQRGPEQHAQQHPIKQKSDAASEESPESAGCGGRLRLEMATADLDKTIVARLVRPRAHVPEYLVAPRVQHGLLFGELAGVFVLADRRMIRRELANRAVPDQIKPRVAHMADHHLARVH